MTFVWNEKTFKTYSEIIDCALSLEEKEQAAFVKAFSLTGPYALQNIGYISGYYSPKKADKILHVFKTAHPIFGTTHPSFKEALEMGFKLGEAAREKK